MKVLDDTRAAAPPQAGQSGEPSRRRTSPEMWRSLDELAGSERFQELVEREFPRYAPNEWGGDLDRRNFLQLAGATLGLAGLAACTRQPPERIVPYVQQPEHLVPGKPQFYATAMTLGGYGTGLLAESHMGRPTKLAGNPEHPATSGGTDVFAQAAILGLYDPDRSKSIDRSGRILPWEEFVAQMRPVRSTFQALRGDGLAILTPATSSPSVRRLIDELRQEMPQLRWVQYEAVHRGEVVRASEAAFGEIVDTHYDVSRADVVLALDADFLTSGSARLRHAKDFAKRRRLRDGGVDLNRLYALEPSPTATGTMADHRVPATPAEIESFAAALAARLGVGGAAAGGDLRPELAAVLEAVAADLESHRGRSVVIAGEQTPASLQVLVHGLNHALGNVGTTVRHTEPVLAEPGLPDQELAELVGEMRAGRVEALFVLGANPVYDAPAELGFGAALAEVPIRVHLGLYRDETAGLCTWHLPQAHFLEGWGDVRATDGTVSVVQPLIEPLYDGRTDLEVLAVLAGQPAESYEIVRETWRRAAPGGFEERWRRAVHDGFVPDSAAAERMVSFAGVGGSATATESAATAAGGGDLALVLRPDPSLYDGRFANNGWLQELPKPITKLTWDGVATLSVATAARLGLDYGDVVKVELAGRTVEFPVWVQPGQADDTVVVPLGYGREGLGRVADGIGDNANRVRPASGAYQAAGATVRRTGRKHELASTQEHYQMLTWQASQAERRHLVRHADLAHYREDPHFATHADHHVPNAPMFPRWKYEGYSWGMAIDLGACTGCNACITACQAENNIPVVGKDQVLKGREMLWLRIDRYYQGDPDDPVIHHQPVACQHCENAPCEVVCPVGATVHSDEGLNDMAYNRCIGTRYCSNNCPYKVRRFNFLKYADTKTPVLKLQRNPDVSVRTRGVMEKCTYCVQRINTARIEAKREERRIRDGEIRTACQEACPSDAISFGDLNDESSEVVRWKASDLNYELLHDLATLPRTTYLAKVSNPHPALAPAHGGGHGSGDHGGDDSTSAAEHHEEAATTGDDHGAEAH